jgi:HEAT repeat protein
MPEVTLSPELRQRVERLAHALLAARRAFTLYPPEHPAAGAGLDRLQEALAAATGGLGLTVGVTPTSWLVGGAPADGGPVAEAAALLHGCDILEVSFAGRVPRETLRAFVELVATAPDRLRREGGPAVVWAHRGHDAIAIVQVDYREILKDRDSARTPATKDDLWRAIVQGVTERHRALDEALQQRLLEIAGDVGAIGELARDVMAPARMPDGSPLVTTRAAAVLAVYRHLAATVAVLDPDRRDQLLKNLAAATLELDPRVALQVVASAGEGGESAALAAELAAAFDDDQVAQLLATTLALDGQATSRLAQVFETLAPDAARKQRVLRLARDRLRPSDFGRQSAFETLWTSVEELLVHYTERPFVSAGYRAALDAAHDRARELSAVDLPPEAPAWFRTLDQDNVRRLSVTLLVDLLNLETQAERADDLVKDLASMAEDLLMAGDYEPAREVVRALAAKAADNRAVTSAASRVALDRLAQSAPLREAVELLGDLNEASAEVLAELCRCLGPPVVDVLLPLLAAEEATRGRARATEVILALGPSAIGRLAPLVADGRWYTQRNAAWLLGRLGSREAVPLLQTLLRSPDPRVIREAARALAAIDDPAAARAVHAVLRAASGPARQVVVAALVAERDPRVVPVLLRILAESRLVRRDHAIVLETLDALGTLGRDEAVGDIERVMRRRSVFAWRKMRAVKRRALEALRAIGTPAALAAIEEGARTGDWMLRRLARSFRS